MCEIQLAIKPTFTVDFGISPRLIKLYADSTHCEWVGEKDGPYDLAKAEEMLNKYASTGIYGNHKRDGFLKIFYGNALVGFAIPRAITKKEHPALKLDVSKDYYRIGTVYIDPAYRGKGIMRETIKNFLDLHPNMMWSCNALNKASHAAALSGGLKLSHCLYVKDTDTWAFEPFAEMVKVVHIFATS